MRGHVEVFFVGMIIGAVLAAASVLLAVGGGEYDCEKDLPRTQECTLQWVKPEASK